GPAAAFHIAQETDSLLAHAPDALHGLDLERRLQPNSVALGLIAVLGDAHLALCSSPQGTLIAGLALIPCDGAAATPVCTPFVLQPRRDPVKLSLKVACIVGQHFDQVYPLGRAF